MGSLIKGFLKIQVCRILICVLAFLYTSWTHGRYQSSIFLYKRNSLLTFSGWICMCTAIFFCMDSTVLPWVASVVLLGPSRLPGQCHLVHWVIWLVKYFPYVPSMLTKPFWCCGQHAVWDTISLSSLVKTDAEDLMSFFPMTFFILQYPFHTSVGKWSANQLAVFHLKIFLNILVSAWASVARLS